MTVRDLVDLLSLELLTACDDTAREVTGGYVSDLLSNVMGHSLPGQVWITSQVHINVVAVASLVSLAAVIIAGGVKPGQDVIEKASQEKVILLATPLPAFEVVGRLYELGIKGQC